MFEAAWRRVLRSRATWTIVAGLVFAALGYLVAFGVLQTPMRIFVRGFVADDVPVPSLVALASFLVGGFSWWLVVERPRRVTRVRGGLAGLLTGLLAHPAMWILFLGYDANDYGAYPWEEGALTFVLLFSTWSLAFTGVVTVTLGVCAGVAVALARERTVEPADDEPRRLGLVVGTWGVSGILTLTVLLLTAFLLPAFVLGGLLATGASALALRRLPVVRTFLLRAYLVSSDPSTTAVTRRRFLLPHLVATLLGWVVFFLGFFGYGVLTEFLYSLASNALPLSKQTVYYRDRIYLYPVFAVGCSLPVVLTANHLLNHYEPARSLRRATLEWTAFLALVVATYTGTAALWLHHGQSLLFPG